MNKETYDWYKSNGICTHCRHEKAVDGKTLCLVCLMENRKYRSKKDKSKTAESDKLKYQTRKDKGVCVVCGKNPQQHGLKCNRCYSRIKVKKEQNRADITRSERSQYGLCYVCGKPKMKDRNVCSECYEKRLTSISKIMYLPVSDDWRKQENIRHTSFNR